jgi:ornithine cyclodeaminase
VPWRDAIDAIRQALVDGLDPGSQPARTAVPMAAGELLLMPAEFGAAAGVKVLSVAPGNDALGLPRIQATYTLMDSRTLAPIAVLDGAALTTLRTPALSAVAVDALAAADARRLVVLGAGPQAEGHVHAMLAIRPVDDVRIVSRSAGGADALVGRLARQGLRAVVGTPADVADADLVVAATSAAAPVIDGGLVRDGAVVVAVGSHHPGRRELPAALLGRSLVVVEDVATALREAGDVVMALEEGALDVEALLPIAELVRGPRRERGAAPAVFKSVGQGWQDLVVAGAALAASRRSPV